MGGAAHRQRRARRTRHGTLTVRHGRAAGDGGRVTAGGCWGRRRAHLRLHWLLLTFGPEMRNKIFPVIRKTKY